MDELTMKFQKFEIQIRQIQDQMQAIEQAVQDMNLISSGLDELKGKTGEEILAPVGKGIFVKAKLLSEDLTVNVGSEKFVKKSIDETKELIENQQKKLREARAMLDEEIEMINQEITQEMVKHQKELEKK